MLNCGYSFEILFHKAEKDFLERRDIFLFRLSDQQERVVLNILVLRVQFLHNLSTPLSDHFLIRIKHLQTRQQSPTGYALIGIIDQTLDVSFDLDEVRWVDDQRNDSQRIPSKVGALVVNVFHQRRGDDVD